MNKKEKDELNEKLKAEAKNTDARIKEETTKSVSSMRNRLLSDPKNAKYGGAPSGDIHWKDLPTKRKVSLINSWVWLAIAIAYVIIVTNSPAWWGEDALLSRVFSNKTYEATGNFFVDYAKPLFGTIFYVLAILGTSKILREILAFSLRRATRKTITIGKLVSSAIKYAAGLILVFIILGIWGVDTATILASAGILALIVGLGAQTLIADIIGGISIVFEEQFEIGDLVVIDSFRGTVKEIGLSTTRLEDAAGNLKIIRNSQISTIINLSHDLSVAVVNIAVDYDTDLEKLRGYFAVGLPPLAKKIKGLKGAPTYLGVDNFGDSKIGIKILGRCLEEDKFGVTRALNEAVFKILKDNNVMVPFPQVVISKREGSQNS